MEAGAMALAPADIAAPGTRLCTAGIASDVPAAAVHQNGNNDASEADRLAAFAMGCLGLSSIGAVGKKLGLMGSATLEEFENVLLYLEQLHLRYVAKLAGGCAVAVAAAHEATMRSTLGGCFEREVLRAVEVQSIAELFARLPHDSKGHADLCFVFGLTPAAGTADACSKAENRCVEFTAEYTERACDLPQPLPVGAFADAVRTILLDADEEHWEVDASAVNAIRAAVVVEPGGVGDAGTTGAEALVARAIAKRCSSRRPALAKAALHILGELAGSMASTNMFNAHVGSQSPPAVSNDTSAWAGGEATREIVAACLGASKGTKMVARVADQSLAAIVQRIVADVSPAMAASVLAMCTASAAKAKPAQPAVVATGLKALLPLAPRVQSPEAFAHVQDACEVVLTAKSLSATFATARAIQRQLPNSAA